MIIKLMLYLQSGPGALQMEWSDKFSQITTLMSALSIRA